MKTQLDNLQNTHSLTNNLMFLSIIFLGLLLFIVSGTNFWMSTFTSTKSAFGHFNQNNSNSNYFLIDEKDSENEREDMRYYELKNLSSTISDGIDQKLEIDKMRQKINCNKQKAYAYVINSFTDVEEPEEFLESFKEELALQEKQFNNLNNNRYVIPTNDYLAELYKEKNNEIMAEIAMNYNNPEQYNIEKEIPLELEPWFFGSNYKEIKEFGIDRKLALKLAQKNTQMYTDIVAEELLELYAAKEKEEVLKVETWIKEDVLKVIPLVSDDQFLALRLNEKNYKIYEEIEFVQSVKGFLAVENEEPLVVENWMVSERCWCPERKKKKQWYHEIYAYNGK